MNKKLKKMSQNIHKIHVRKKIALACKSCFVASFFSLNYFIQKTAVNLSHCYIQNEKSSFVIITQERICSHIY